MKAKLLVLSVCLLSFYAAVAQPVFKRKDDIKVTVGADTLLFPWVGGLNTPQFSEADLNNDGIMDLVVYNRGISEYNPEENGDKLLTFINHGTTGQVDYTYAPEYQENFPYTFQYVGMADFNCDGVADIISITDQSALIAYFGRYNTDNQITFGDPDTLYYQYQSGSNTLRSPMVVLSTGLPALSDIDNDGDMDILAYDYAAGAFINFYQNMSEELSGTCADSMIFEISHYCWGRMAVSPTSNHVNFNISDGDCFGRPVRPNPGDGHSASPRHLGGTICAYDPDNDGDKDLLLGDISYNVITSVTNGGRPDTAFMVGPADTTFPSYDTSINLTIYPAAFNLDVNNDGKKDLLVAPNAPRGSENTACVWYYKNISSNDTAHYHYQTDSFLVNKMIDLGEGAYPAFMDIDGDGLLDMLVGNTGYYVSSVYSKGGLAYFKNVGTINQPAFELVDRDYLHLSNLQVNGLYIQSIAPAFGDMDGDGDLDLIVGDGTGYLQYFRNDGGVGQPASFTQVGQNYFFIDAGNNSVPYIYDVNGDSLPDLVVGHQPGNIEYYQNRGTRTNASFDRIPNNPSFGNIDVRQGNPQNGFSLTGYSAPVITPLDSTGRPYVLVGNELGNIEVYEFNRDSILSGSFNKVSNIFSGIDVGERAVLAVGQFTNNGKYDLVVGNNRGGLSFYSQTDSFFTGISHLSNNDFGNVIQVKLFPNPANNNVNLVWQMDGLTGTPEIELIDMLGRRVLYKREEAGNWSRGNVNLDLNGLAKGLYNCRLSINGHYVSKKLLLQ